MSIKNNWEKINSNIAMITNRDVTVVAVTKKRSVADICEVINIGADNIGENRVEEAYEKFINQNLIQKFPNARRHMIGNLQRRKVKLAVQLFDCIQSVDSEKLAVEIDKRSSAIDKVMDILIEVNISGEEQKLGVNTVEVYPLVEKILSLRNIRLKGLMTMAPYTSDEKVLRNVFAGLRKLSENLSDKFGKNFFEILSMGMSNDYKIAVEEGSNMVRIGTVLFASQPKYGE